MGDYQPVTLVSHLGEMANLMIDGENLDLHDVADRLGVAYSTVVGWKHHAKKMGLLEELGGDTKWVSMIKIGNEYEPAFDHASDLDDQEHIDYFMNRYDSFVENVKDNILGHNLSDHRKYWEISKKLLVFEHYQSFRYKYCLRNPDNHFAYLLGQKVSARRRGDLGRYYLTVKPALLEGSTFNDFPQRINLSDVKRDFIYWGDGCWQANQDKLNGVQNDRVERFKDKMGGVLI